MYWGQFVTVVGKDTYPCGADCGEGITPGQRHYNLVNKAKTTGKLFTRRIHVACFHQYIEENELTRREEINQKRKERPGRPGLALTPEQKKRRYQLLRAIYDAKQKLAQAYYRGSQEAADRAKASLARYLTELLSTQEYKFQWGKELDSLIRAGKDRVLRAADLETDRSILEVLGQTEASTVPVLQVDTRTPQEISEELNAELNKRIKSILEEAHGNG